MLIVDITVQAQLTQYDATDAAAIIGLISKNARRAGAWCCCSPTIGIQRRCLPEFTCSSLQNKFPVFFAAVKGIYGHRKKWVLRRLICGCDKERRLQNGKGDLRLS